MKMIEVYRNGANEYAVGGLAKLLPEIIRLYPGIEISSLRRRRNQRLIHLAWDAKISVDGAIREFDLKNE